MKPRAVVWLAQDLWAAGWGDAEVYTECAEKLVREAGALPPAQAHRLCVEMAKVEGLQKLAP